jgi:hypothetical protein
MSKASFLSHTFYNNFIDCVRSEIDVSPGHVLHHTHAFGDKKKKELPRKRKDEETQP